MQKKKKGQSQERYIYRRCRECGRPLIVGEIKEGEVHWFEKAHAPEELRKQKV